jgi:DNA-binding transcriptional regulator YiaG
LGIGDTERPSLSLPASKLKAIVEEQSNNHRAAVTYLLDRLLKGGVDHSEAQFIRERAGLSLRDVAAEIGVSTGTLSRWEAGRKPTYGPDAVTYCGFLASLMRSQLDEAFESGDPVEIAKCHVFP